MRERNRCGGGLNTRYYGKFSCILTVLMIHHQCPKSWNYYIKSIPSRPGCIRARSVHVLTTSGYGNTAFL